MKIRITFVFLAVAIVTTFFLLTCHRHPGAGPEKNSAITAEQTERHIRLLRDRLDYYLEHKESPDSLRYADYFLDQLETYAGEESWYLSARSEVSFLYATYAELPEDTIAALYSQGVSAAESYLSMFPELFQYIQTAQRPIDSVDTTEISGETLNVVYWWTVNSLFRSTHVKAIRRLTLRNRVEKSIALIKQIDPNYRNGGPQRLTGLLHLFSPDGDLNQSRKSFQAAIDIAPAYLENSFYYGRYYGVLLQNREVFLQNLNIVIQQPVDSSDSYYQLNQLVQNRAGQVLNNEEEYFTALTRNNLLNFTE